MFFSWIRKQVNRPTGTLRRSKSSAKTKKSIGSRLGVECLEDRAVPAFLTPVSMAAGLNPSGIAVADYNGDGKSDMAVVNGAVAGTVGIMLSNGDGTFQAKVDYATGANALDARA